MPFPKNQERIFFENLITVIIKTCFMTRLLKSIGLCVLLLLALCSQNQLYAQGKQITGKVTSSENKQVAAGVSVSVKGTKTATTTDADGNYKITVDSKATTLVFSSASFISYETKIDGRTVIDVELIADVKVIDDVVVVGYSSVKRPDGVCILRFIKTIKRYSTVFCC
jgi:TonB-dependent starch-binding outer membrane protein SusC